MAIQESAAKKKPEFETLATFQDPLKDKLMSLDQFFLVLDKVCYEDNSSGWGKSLAPLGHGQKGSKFFF